MESAALPTAGTLAATVQRGKYPVNSAIGPEGAQDNSRGGLGGLVFGGVVGWRA